MEKRKMLTWLEEGVLDAEQPFSKHLPRSCKKWCMHNVQVIRTCFVEQWIYAEKKSTYKFCARFKRLLPSEIDANTITSIDSLKIYPQTNREHSIVAKVPSCQYTYERKWRSLFLSSVYWHRGAFATFKRSRFVCGYVKFLNHSLHIRTTMMSLMHIFYGMLAREFDLRIWLGVCVYVELIHNRCTHEIAINIFEWCSATVHIRIGRIKRNGFPVAGVHLHERVHHRPVSNHRKFIAYILRNHIHLNAAWLYIRLL